MRAAGSEGLFGPAFFVPYARESLEGAGPIRSGYGGSLQASCTAPYSAYADLTTMHLTYKAADVRASILGSEETLHI
jgi:hypothetical protein